MLVPTRELAVQVTEVFELVGRARRIRVASVYGGMPLRKQAERHVAPRWSSRRPGRLQDLIERKLLSIDAVQVLVLDEADRMLDMGFKPQVDRIVRRLPADAPDDVLLRDARRRGGRARAPLHAFPSRFEAELPEEHRSGDVDHQFVPVTAENKVQTLVGLLPDDGGLALVFVRTKAGADRLVEKLRRHDVDAVAIHGDKAQAQRERALARFDSGKVRTLVATDVAARGLDVDDITHVINFDPPDESSSYTHRVGRTGRAGRGGTGITLVLPEQQADVSRVARLQGHTERFEESGMTMARPKLVYTSRRGTALEVVDERLTAKQAEALRRRARGARRARAAPRSSPRSRRRASSATCPRTSSTTRRRTSRGCSRRASARCAPGSTTPRSSRQATGDEVGIGSVVEVVDEGGEPMTVEISGSRRLRHGVADLAARVGAPRPQGRRDGQGPGAAWAPGRRRSARSASGRARPRDERRAAGRLHPGLAGSSRARA